MRRPSRFSPGAKRPKWVRLCQISLLTTASLIVCGIYARFLWPTYEQSESDNLRTDTMLGRAAAGLQRDTTLVRGAVSDKDVIRKGTVLDTDLTKARADKEKLWLTIGIPTVPRRNEMDYLMTTVETLLQELPSRLDEPLYQKIRVIIMNNKKGEHVVFDRAKKLIQDPGPDVSVAQSVAASHMEFIENPGEFLDPYKGKIEEPDDLNNPSSRPGSAVRQQTCDLITLMDEALQQQSDYYMFMEDDFKTCGKALEATKYAIGLATEMSPSWLALRVSYGMNGIVMRSRDLPAFSDFMREHLALLPPDLLWIGYLGGHTYNRPDQEETIVHRGALMVFKHNLFDHIGTVSSFEVRPDRPKWPGCYESMAKVWSLQDQERFDARCDEFDISPCLGLTADSKAALIFKGGHPFEPP